MDNIINNVVQKYNIRSALSLPPVDCTNKCMSAQCNCSGEFRVIGLDAEEVVNVIETLESEIKELKQEVSELYSDLSYIQDMYYDALDAANGC